MSPTIIWVSIIGFIFVVGFLYKKVQELTMASTKEIPLEDCVGHKDNVHVFIDFGIKDRFKDDLIGRVEFELFTNKLPLTCENFRCFITGEKGDGATGKPMHYKGVKFHRIIPGFMLQGGDHIQGDGSGGESIYGRCFDDEWPEGGHVKHSKPGMLSMANGGPHTNGSQFFLTFAKAKWLDRKARFRLRTGRQGDEDRRVDRDEVWNVHGAAPAERRHQRLRPAQEQEPVKGERRDV